MDKEEIFDIINDQFNEKTYEYFDNGYYFKETHVCYGESKAIKTEINCSCEEDMLISGWVNINIDINKILENHVVGFGCLEVPIRIQNRGIGTALMLKVIEVTRIFKEYYKIDEIELIGSLSQTDCQNDNWKNSIPFYEKVGQKAGVITKFNIKNQNKVVSTKEEFFREVGKSDGEINYYF